MAKRLTTEEFIEKAKVVHGDKYDYSKVVYTKSHDSVTVICKKHGEFRIKAYSFIAGKGCGKCGGRGLSKRDFVKKAKTVHGEKYSYELTEFKLMNSKVNILCKTHNKVFYQNPSKHIQGQGCPLCAVENNGNRKRLSRRNTLVEDFKKVHGDTYLYDKVVYTESNVKVTITCKLHGDWDTIAYDHLQGHGCPECANSKAAYRQRLNIEEFLVRSKETHDDTYDYSKFEYKGNDIPSTIICRVHGEFLQRPANHWGGQGCPSCSHIVSKAETVIADHLSKTESIQTHNRKILAPKELDIVIPDKMIAVEYNGNYWHSEKFQSKWALVDKQELCRVEGYRLIHVMEYEDTLVVKKTLDHILGNTRRIFARNCKVKEVQGNSSELKSFLNENHLQGYVQGCKAYTLFYDGEIISAMLFSRASSERGNLDRFRYELRRFASSCRVVGGASKLLAAFTRSTTECSSIVSYSDTRWFTGGMYEKLGFKFVHSTGPDYKYIKSNMVASKSSFRRSELEKRPDINFKEEETEVQNANRNGWHRLWDCGKKKWELTL